MSKLTHLQILLVEDEAVTRTALMVLLECQGATVIAVGSVKEGIHALDTFTPDILLSNIHLPDGVGAEVLQNLRDRNSRVGKFTPAIALTGAALAIVRTDPALAGFQVYMSKPFDSELLISTILRLAGGDLTDNVGK
ncbi:MAG: response regulator [Leptolyngbyaceae cyanobacterium CSU_1_3]|nr:response regulator [Leptolyngbyaceae cyanobacterium CSU_1_3]